MVASHKENSSFQYGMPSPLKVLVLFRLCPTATDTYTLLSIYTYMYINECM